VCEKTGELLASSGELLFRQIYPSWLDEDGEPSSQAFFPWRPIDDGCLSVDRESMASAEDSHHLSTAAPPDGFGLNSVGVWGFAIEEVVSLGLEAWSDPVTKTRERPANPAHSLVEFAGAPQKKWRKLGRELKLKALARGKLHPRAM
jgi:hypothetical protein